jgi:TIR domain/Biotin-requiring enzyme
MRVEIRLPRIGEGPGSSEMTVTRILVAPGDRIQRDQTYMEVSDEKADIELPSAENCRVVEVAARQGEVKKTGDVLLVVETDDPPQIVERAEESANVRTSLQYLSEIDPEQLCSRPELGARKFTTFLPLIEQIVSLAREFRHLPLERLDESLIKELQEANFFVSSFIRRLGEFNPDSVSAARDHATITREIQDDKDEAVRLFHDVLWRAGGGAVGHGPVSEDEEGDYHPERAWVFISYSHDDEEPAQQLADRLRREHIGHFIDRSLSKGDLITDRIHRQLERATHLVVLVSPGSDRSAWVSYEVGFASARGITLVPYLTHPSAKVPSFLHNVRAVKHRQDRKEEKEWFQELKAYRPPAPSKPSFFSEWDPIVARARLRGAKEVCHQAIASFAFLQECAPSLIEMVKSGGSLRCVMISPHGEAVKMAMHRHYGTPRVIGFVGHQQYLAWQQIREIASHASWKDAVKLKIIDYLLEPIMTIVDPTSVEGTMFVTLSGFEQPLTSRPSFVLHKNSDPTWFQFYQDSFEQLWKHPHCRSMDLDSGEIIDEGIGTVQGTLVTHEAELVGMIRADLPPERAARYAALQEKLNTESMSKEEYRELLGLITEVERLETQRNLALAELARLRGTSLAAVAHSLGIRKRS